MTSGSDACRPFASDVPPVLGAAVAAWHDEAEPLLRIWAACDLAEMTLRLAALAGLADVVQRSGGRLPETLHRQVRPRLDEPTLGKWQGIALAVGEHLTDTGGVSVGAELHDVVRLRLVPMLDGPAAHAPDPFSSMRAMRNRLAHGGGVSRQLASRLLERWEPEIESLCGELRRLSLRFVVRTADGWALLAGPRAEPSGPPAPSALPALDRLCADERVAVVEGQAAVGLGPLAAWSVLQSDARPVLQVYARRVDVRVLLTPIAVDDLAQSEANPDAALALARWLKDPVQRADGRSRAVQGFEAAFLREAQAFVGRETELARCVEMLAQPGVWTVLGRAGTGKSLLLARLVQHLVNQHDDEPWLAWRFTAGDPRCHRMTFLSFVAERLAVRVGAPPPSGPVTLARVIGLAKCAPPTRLLIDGIDEILELDPGFSDVLARLALPGWKILVAGRPDPSVMEAIQRIGGAPVFADGLPLMGDGDVRTMLLERLGPLRRALLRHDESAGEGAENALVARIARASAGLPLYVNYVLGDLLSGRAALDALDTLPPTLAAYHDELLGRGQTGDVQVIATWCIVSVSLAREPLDVEALAALLVHRGLLLDGSETLVLVRRALAAVGGLLRADPEGFVPYHHSLRQHVLGCAALRATVRACAYTYEELAAPGASVPDCLVGYIGRQGTGHLLAGQRIGAAVSRLSDPRHVVDEAQLRRELGDLVAALAADAAAVDPIEPALLIRALVLRPENALLMPGAAYLYRHWPDFLASEAGASLQLGVTLTYALALAITNVHRDGLAAADVVRIRAWASDHSCPVQYAALYSLSYLAMRHPEAWPPDAIRATVVRSAGPSAAGNVYDRMVVLNHLAYRACCGQDPATILTPGAGWGSGWPYLRTDEALVCALSVMATGRAWQGRPGLPCKQDVDALLPHLDAIEGFRLRLLTRPSSSGFGLEVARDYWTLLGQLDGMTRTLEELVIHPDGYELCVLLLAHPAWQIGELAAEALARRWAVNEADRGAIELLARRLEPFPGAGLLGDRDIAMPTLARMLLRDVEDADAVVSALGRFIESPASHQRGKAVLEVTQIVRSLDGGAAERMHAALAPILGRLADEPDVWVLHELTEWVRLVEERGFREAAFLPERHPLLARVPDWRSLSYDALMAAFDAEWPDGHRQAVGREQWNASHDVPRDRF